MTFKIYTKTGDQGQTSLIGGTRVPKHHIRIESYGTVDELNSWIGMLRDQTTDENTLSLLIEIQDRLFTIGSLLAADPEKNKMELPQIAESDIAALERAIDAINEEVPPMKSFVLPGGHPAVSHCHVARCVCRRAERNVIHLTETAPVDPLIVKYLNRLSDYLFMLSRQFSHRLNATETPWKPRM
jgi:cob(I)alamin adenosyltransferase